MSAPSVFAVQRVLTMARATLEDLRGEHGQVIEDDDTLLASLSDEGVDVDGLLCRWMRSALDDKASAAAADARLDDLTARRNRYRRAEETKRGVVLAIMETIGLTKFRDPEFTLSVSAGKPKVLITDETLLPDELVTVTVTRTPDKVMIKQALYDNGEVPGAVLSNSPPVLTVRSK